MPTTKRVDWDAVDLAAPHAVIKTAELDQLGVPRRTVSDRTGADGPWQRLLPGVLLLHNGTPSREQRLDAALRYAGERALITGLTAANLFGLTRSPRDEVLHVLVPEPSHLNSSGFVSIERTTRMPQPVLVDGFRTSGVCRSVLDGARRLTRRSEVRALLGETVQRRLVAPADLRRELDAGSQRGSAVVREVLQEIDDGVRSAAEGWAYQLARNSDLPPMSWNVSLFDERGRFLAKPDGWIDQVGLAWEIDSYEFHLAPEDYRRTLDRHARMTACGVTVVHTIPSRLRTEPNEVLAELRGAYEHARQRPRPPVFAR